MTGSIPPLHNTIEADLFAKGSVWRAICGTVIFHADKAGIPAHRFRIDLMIGEKVPSHSWRQGYPRVMCDATDLLESGHVLPERFMTQVCDDIYRILELASLGGMIVHPAVQ